MVHLQYKVCQTALIQRKAIAILLFSVKQSGFRVELAQLSKTDDVLGLIRLGADLEIVQNINVEALWSLHDASNRGGIAS